MLFQKFDQYQDQGTTWTELTYTATWPYGRDFMISASQVILGKDFQGKRWFRQLLADDRDLSLKVKEKGLNLYALEELDSCSTLTLSGISRIMEVPIQVTFFAGTDEVLLESSAGKYFAKYGAHVFDRYMDSVEIMARCDLAVREAGKAAKKKDAR